MRERAWAVVAGLCLAAPHLKAQLDRLPVEDEAGRRSVRITSPAGP